MWSINKAALTVVMIAVVVSAGVACTPRIFGIPQDQWVMMDAQERDNAKRAYQERQKILEQQRLEAEQRRREEAERQRLIAEQRAAEQRRHIEDIYAGRAGVYGDLVRVTVQGGSMDFGDKQRHYQPLTFRIANGENKAVTFARSGERSYATRIISVVYRDGNLLFDVGKRESMQKYAKRLIYDSSWDRGRTYSNITLSGHSVSEARGINITVQVVPLPGYRR